MAYPSLRTPVRFLSPLGKKVRDALGDRDADVVMVTTTALTVVHDNLRRDLVDQKASYEEKLGKQRTATALIQKELSRWWTPVGVSPTVLLAIRNGAFEHYPSLGTLVFDAVRNHGAVAGIRHDDAFHNVMVALYDQGGVRRALDVARLLNVKISSATIRVQGRVVPSAFGLTLQSVRSAMVAILRQRDPAAALAAHVLDLSADPADHKSLWKLRGPAIDTPAYASSIVHLLGVTDETKLRRSLLRVKNTGIRYSLSVTLTPCLYG
jgi:hypothetical protein